MFLKQARDSRNENNVGDAEQAHNKRHKNNSDRNISVLASAVDFMQVETSNSDPDTSTKSHGKSVHANNSINSSLKRIETSEQKKND